MICGGWIVKLMIHPTLAGSWREVWNRVALGHIPAWVVLTIGTVFYASLAATWWFGRSVAGGEPEDEISGIESNLDAWKL